MPKELTMPPAAPPDRGRLWYDNEIPKQFFGDLPDIEDKLRWVRSHLPRESRVKIGKRSAWFEKDILEYRSSLRGKGRAAA